MGVELNSTLNQFVNWASQTGIGKDDLVHAKTTQGATGAMTVTLSDNKGDGIGFFAARRRSADVKNANNETRKLFMDAVIKMFGKTIDDVPKSVRNKMQLNDYKDKGRPLSARRIMIVTNAITNAIRADKIGFKVGGWSFATDAMNGFFDAKLDSLQGSKKEKVQKAISDIGNVAKNEFNRQFAENMRILGSGDLNDSSFMKDHERMFPTTLKFGKTVLSYDKYTSLEKKLSIIAQFASAGKTNDFKALKGDDLKKAHVFMSLSNQFLMRSMESGITVGLDPEMRDDVLKFGGQVDEEASAFRAEFNDDGSLSVRVEEHYEKVQFSSVNNDDQEENKAYMNFDPGAKQAIIADIKIGSAELESICQKDYSKFDYGAVIAVRNTYEGSDPVKASAEKMGEYRFGTDVSFNVAFSANYTDCTIIQN